MSNIWSAGSYGDAAAVPVIGVGRRPSGSFRSLFAPQREIFTPEEEPQEIPMAAVFEEEKDPLEQIRIEAFTMGFEEGSRLTEETLNADQSAANRLAKALEILTPAPNPMLSSLLSASVMRLVEQIVGEVEIDVDRLLQRCDAVAAFIGDDDQKGALYLNPEDVALVEGHALGVRLVADPGMQRGCVRLETGQGWVEDGPDMRLSRLRSMLDTMEGRP